MLIVLISFSIDVKDSWLNEAETFNRYPFKNDIN